MRKILYGTLLQNVLCNKLLSMLVLVTLISRQVGVENHLWDDRTCYIDDRTCYIVSWFKPDGVAE